MFRYILCISLVPTFFDNCISDVDMDNMVRQWQRCIVMNLMTVSAFVLAMAEAAPQADLMHRCLQGRLQ